MSGSREQIRVLLADDNSAVRYGFRLIIDSQPDMQVVAETANGEDALDVIQKCQPDVAIMDVRMPRMDGLMTIRSLAHTPSTTRIIVATSFDDDAYVYEALRLGVSGFLIKVSASRFLVEAIRATHQGEAFMSPSVTVRLLRHVKSETPTPSRGEHVLTSRELELAKLIARGMSNAEIADALYISVGTVKTHVANTQRKLDVSNRIAIAAWVWACGHADPNR
jgi:DNA-binding NarL/FixJ family response regulator